VPDLSVEDLDHLPRVLRSTLRSAIRKGGADTGPFVAARGRDGVCPNCGQPVSRATIGGRTTCWCPACQH